MGDLIGGDKVLGDKVLGDKHVHLDGARYDVHGLPSPYLGLRAFSYAERARFAGRQRVINDALAKLVTPGAERVLLFITGASGAGKSSLAQAGVVPALERWYAERGLLARHAVMRPAPQPAAAFADALGQLGWPSLPAPRPATPPLLQLLRTSPLPGQLNLLVIDQFEELFSPQCDPGERAAIMALLLDLVEVSPDDNARRDVRRRRTLAQLLGGTQLPGRSALRRRLVADLCAARLLRADADLPAPDAQAPAEVQVDIIHESLIANWTRLGQAIQDQREQLQRRAHFERALADWLGRCLDPVSPSRTFQRVQHARCDVCCALGHSPTGIEPQPQAASRKPQASSLKPLC